MMMTVLSPSGKMSSPRRGRSAVIVSDDENDLPGVIVFDTKNDNHDGNHDSNNANNNRSSNNNAMEDHHDHGDDDDDEEEEEEEARDDHRSSRSKLKMARPSPRPSTSSSSSKSSPSKSERRRHHRRRHDHHQHSHHAHSSFSSSASSSRRRNDEWREWMRSDPNEPDWDPALAREERALIIPTPRRFSSSTTATAPATSAATAAVSVTPLVLLCGGSSFDECGGYAVADDDDDLYLHYDEWKEALQPFKRSKQLQQQQRASSSSSSKKEFSTPPREIRIPKATSPFAVRQSSFSWPFGGMTAAVVGNTNSDEKDLSPLTAASALSRKENAPPKKSSPRGMPPSLPFVSDDDEQAYLDEGGPSRSCLPFPSLRKWSSTPPSLPPEPVPTASSSSSSSPPRASPQDIEALQEELAVLKQQWNSKAVAVVSPRSMTPHRRRKSKRTVRFAQPLVTSLQYRPRTLPSEIPQLFFNEEELNVLELDRETTSHERVECVVVDPMPTMLLTASSSSDDPNSPPPAGLYVSVKHALPPTMQRRSSKQRPASPKTTTTTSGSTSPVASSNPLLHNNNNNSDTLPPTSTLVDI